MLTRGQLRYVGQGALSPPARCLNLPLQTKTSLATLDFHGISCSPSDLGSGAGFAPSPAVGVQRATLHGFITPLLSSLLACAVLAPPRGRQVKRRRWKHTLHAAMGEAGGTVTALMEVLKTSRSEKDTVLAACQALPPAPADAAAQLVGDWKVEWSSAGGSRTVENDKAQPATIKLRFLSFGALPEVEVCIVGGFNRVLGSAEKGGMYELFQVFTIPGSNNVTAAMVLGGPWGKDEGGKEGRVSVHFQYVRLVPAASNPDASRNMLSAAGLTVMTPIPVRAPPAFIDVEYIDETVRVHRGESGAVYILSRETVPFSSGVA